MPKVTQKKVGQVFMKEIDKGKWRVDWRDPLTKRRHRVILPASSFKEASEQTQQINSQIAAGRGFAGRLRGTAGHTVSDAVLEAIRHTNANERTRRDYLWRFNPFAEYLAKHASGVIAWNDVTEQVLENYIEHCRREKVAYDTIRLRLYVLRLTSSYMSRTYPGRYRDVAVAIKLRRHDPPKAEIEAKNAILSPSQLRDLLLWLEENEPMVNLWGVLQGLCGLRLYEAAYLREQDFDPVAKTITITETSAHSPKNRSSYRTIPVCGAAAAVMRNWIAGLKVRHSEGYLFVPTHAIKRNANARLRETRAGAYTYDRINHLWARALNQAKTSGVNLPKQFTPRRLRATFITAMRKAHVDFEILQAYVGHAPRSTLSAHYDEVDLDRLAVVAEMAQELCEIVDKKQQVGALSGQL